MNRDTDDFLASLPKAERLITSRLRALILDSDPGIQERFSYGVPYFFKRRRVAFIWPASAPQGPKDGLVSLGFCYGYLLSNEQGILKMEGRTQVAIVRFKTLDEIDEIIINEILQEALLVDGLQLSKKR